MTTTINLYRKIWLATAVSFVLLLLAGTASAQWTTSGTNVYYNGGNVGIGTSSPDSPLHVKGDTGNSVAAVIRLRGTNSSAKTTRLQFEDYSGGISDGLIDFDVTSGTAAGSLLRFGVNSTSQLVLKGDGNVGIGTTSPATPLHVSGAGGEMFRITGTSNTNPYLTLVDAGGVTAFFKAAKGANSVLLGSTTNHLVAFYTNGTEKMQISAGGNVGIGTTSPTAPLHVQFAGDKALKVETTTASTGVSRIQAIGPGTQAQVSLEWREDIPGGMALLQTGKSNNSPNFGILSGNVGIGTTNPGSKLYVSGGDIGLDGNKSLFLSAYLDTGISENPSTGVINFTVPGNGTTRGFNFQYGATSKMFIDGTTGNINIAGTINAKYQDVAEWVPSSEQIPTGTVVVLDATKSNQVISSTQSYDTRVAGVVSERPGLALGEGGEGRVLVATTGRVLVKVDASNGPIHIGDLLVTSDIPGLAMKSEPITIGNRKMHMPGTLIGKALEPLEKGSGKILVLLSLQ